ncbi:MAG: hypothetical protein AAGE52_37580, partial [Myxococcota bacterium]
MRVRFFVFMFVLAGCPDTVCRDDFLVFDPDTDTCACPDGLVVNADRTACVPESRDDGGIDAG